MTSAKSTFSYCGAGLEAALEVTCSGPACDALQGFPDLTCTTSGNGLNCTNGVKCDTDLWITELDFEVPDTTNPRIQQNHTTTIPECDYKFQVTDDGTTAGFQFQNLTAGNAKCNTPVGQEFNLTSTNSTGGSNNTATHTPKASNASRNVKSPFFILFVLVTLIMPSLASYVETRGITPAKPPASLFPDTNICVKYGFKTPTTDLKKRELAVQDLEKRMTELAVLHDRGLGDTLYELTAKFPSFWDRLFDYIGAKLWGKVHNPSGDVFKTCWQGELTSTVCATAIGMSIPALPMLGIVGELVPACMSVINGLAVLDMEPLTKFGLFMGSGIFCNWLVAEALPMIPCLQELICDRVMPKLLPESKCQGPPPNTDAVPLPLKPMTAPEYMSDGGLLKNPNKCGSFFTPCDSNKCENAACTKTACVGKTCETFDSCGPGNGCVCGTILDSSSGFCVYGPTPCEGLADCKTSTQCGAGEVCIESSCCERSVCVGPGVCGGSGTTQKRWPDSPAGVDALLRRGWVNATIYSTGQWVD